MGSAPGLGPASGDGVALRQVLFQLVGVLHIHRYNYLSTHQDGEFYEYVMVGYLLKNTVTENGTVARAPGR
mgnify:CR=1 FL=1